MQLYPKKQTDEEYIESVRKQVKNIKRNAIFYGVMGVFYLVLFMISWKLILFIAGEMQLDGDIEQGFGVGIILGASAGIWVLGTGASFNLMIRHFRGLRTEKLLLRYYDGGKDNCE